MKTQNEVRMAIQPIDLQTLFTQLDKVGKNQSVQKEGLQMQEALQGIQVQKKTDERFQSVNEAQNSGDGAERIKDRNARSSQQQEEGEKKNPQNEENIDTPLRVVTDPALGKNIDVSG